MARFVDQFFTQITGPSQHKAANTLAPKLVLLHGVMGYALNWRRVAKAFEDRFDVLAYDSRGHGRSVHADLKKMPNAYDPIELAEDLRKILDDLGWPKIFLIGHSMGGRVAYTFAARYPERVQALVIEDIGPNMSPVGTSTVTRVLDAVPVPFKDKRAAKEWFDREFPVLFKDLKNAVALAAWLYANITEDENAVVSPGAARPAIWRFHVDGVRAAVVAGHSVERWAEIENLAVPTLLIRGEFSNDLPRDVYEKMLKVAGSRGGGSIEGVEISGAGHWVHSERLEDFNAAIAGFFTKNNATQ